MKTPSPALKAHLDKIIAEKDAEIARNNAEIAKNNAEIAKKNAAIAIENAWHKFANGLEFEALARDVKDFLIEIKGSENDLDIFMSSFSKIKTPGTKFSSKETIDFFDYVEATTSSNIDNFSPIVERSKTDQGVLVSLFDKAYGFMTSENKDSFNKAVLDLKPDYQEICENNESEFTWGGCSSGSKPLDEFIGINEGYNCCISE